MSGVVSILYLITVFCFAIGILMLLHPRTAAKGNMISLLGMVIGLFGALVQPLEQSGSAVASNGNYGWIIGSLILGGAIGLPMAQRVKMTAMPQLVAIFNGLGGASATTIGIVELIKVHSRTPAGSIGVRVLALVMGGVGFTGRVVADLRWKGAVRRQCGVLVPY